MLMALLHFPLSVWGQGVGEPVSRGVGNEYVVLLHGLSRSSRSMSTPAKRLSREGYTVVNVDYPSTEYAIDHLSEVVLADALRKCCSEAEVIHFVTHSLGGIVVRYYLEKHPLPNLGRVVMLSPPNQGSELVDAFKDNLLYEVWNGPAGAELGTDPQSVPSKLGPVAFELGVITGSTSLNPLLSRIIPGPDDGKVSVARATVEGMKDFRVVPYSHTFIMDRRIVMDHVVHFLRMGTFR
ncbi:MAG: esterase/lipase family protein [Rhodothermales bacterium]